MDENKNLTPTEETKAPEEQAQENAVVTESKPAAQATAQPTKKAATPKQAAPAAKSSRFADVKAEFKKIIWPGKAELRKKTGTVIVTSLVMGVIIFAMDTVYTTLYNLVLGLIG